MPILSLSGALVVCIIQARLDVPIRLVLDGVGTKVRQFSGLADQSVALSLAIVGNALQMFTDRCDQSSRPMPLGSISQMHVVLLTAYICALPCHAQLEVPGPIVLDGQASEDRQIHGLADPLTPDAGMNLDAARATATSYTMLQGSASMTGTLFPAPDAYVVGMAVTVVPMVTNSAAATLDLNGLGPRFIVKQGSVALAAGDLEPQVPVRVIYDGEHFQLISSVQLHCPEGQSVVTREYCISDSAFAATSYFNAAAQCAVQGTRLCTFSEWAFACRSMPGFLATVQEAEWVDHAANYTNGAKLVGAGIDGEDVASGTGCALGGLDLPTGVHQYRCCSNR